MTRPSTIGYNVRLRIAKTTKSRQLKFLSALSTLSVDFHSMKILFSFDGLGKPFALNERPAASKLLRGHIVSVVSLDSLMKCNRWLKHKYHYYCSCLLRSHLEIDRILRLVTIFLCARNALRKLLTNSIVDLMNFSIRGYTLMSLMGLSSSPPNRWHSNISVILQSMK